MDERREQALHGGRLTVGIVRVGDTVRRPRHARSEFVHTVLRHLDAAGFDGAPRLLGIDERGREVLTYISGETIDSTPARLCDARLVSAARLIRRFHDATAGTALAAAEEIVAHGDLGPTTSSSTATRRSRSSTGTMMSLRAAASSTSRTRPGARRHLRARQGPAW
jgi:hypothetical protein